jgi:choline-glycine betaine transporter
MQESSPDNSETQKTRLDWPGFLASVSVILLACIPLILFPESGGDFLARVYGQLTSHFGFLYLVSGFSVLVFLLWLALGPYGKVCLTASDEKPEFSTLSWTAMLFCAGVGAGLMFWAPIEWGYYYGAPPFGFNVRNFSLGADSLGHILPANGGDRVSVLRKENDLSQAQHQLSLFFWGGAGNTW